MRNARGRSEMRQNRATRRLHTLGAICLLLSLPLAAPSAHSQDLTTGKVILMGIGCNMSGPPGTAGSACYVSISGSAVGPSGCQSTLIKWDPHATPNGKAALKQLTAAFIAGDQVSFTLEDRCSLVWPSSPTMRSYLILGPSS